MPSMANLYLLNNSLPAENTIKKELDERSVISLPFNPNSQNQILKQQVIQVQMLSPSKAQESKLKSIIV